MSPQDRWARVMELFEAAVEWPAGEVEARLAALEPNPDLRAEVLQLLEADRRAEVQRDAAPSLISAPAETEPLPRALGPYTLTRVLGSGGFGTVYEATRPGPDGLERVAIKRLHARAASADELARFERERYLLASLDSPGIARFVDSGRDEDGRPYLVMELVEGRPIDAHCDAGRLSVAERLRMMAAVCRDVQAAHERLVAHLDLKPSNILVTADGRAKIVDFGTSKLLAPGASTTTIRLTPHYASPEQLRHEPVSTASDTYTLGLILYELATGAWPFGGKGSFVSTADRMLGREAPVRITDTITSDAAERRGTTVARLRHELSGDLEVILQKALAPDPRQRYATAGAFADDLEALVAGRPIAARRRTMAYRAAKFVSRHRVATAVSAATAIAIAALAAVAWSGQQRALAEGRRAQRTVDFLYRMLADASPENGGRRGMTVAELVTRANAALERDESLPIDVRAGVQSVFAYVRFNEGDEADGLALAQQALDRARRSGDASVHAASIGNLVLLQIMAGRCRDASTLASEWDAVTARLPGGAWRARAVALTGRARLASRCEGAPARAEVLTREAVALLPWMADAEISRLDRSSMLAQHAGHLADLGRHDEARAVLDRALAQIAEHPDGDTVRLSLLRLQANSAAAGGDFAAAARLLGDAVGLAPGRSTPFAEVRLRASWATRLAQAGERERALAIARQVRDDAARRASEFATSRWMILVDVADAFMEAGQCADVPALLDEASALASGGMPTAWRVVRLKIDALCRAQSGDRDGARQRAEEALDLGATLLAAAPATERRLRALLDPVPSRP